MPTDNNRRRQRNRERAYDRQMLRAAFQGVFLSVLQTRKKQSGYQLQDLATATSNFKSTISRWFSPDLPNWQIDTIADLADALEVDVIFQARDRATGEIHTPQGVIQEKPPEVRSGKSCLVVGISNAQYATAATSNVVRAGKLVAAG